ncbi:hypothetical protein NDU88_002490 [Pleurodeles waltl]|uniref:Uncharacterized protein n=1 Tax=Pleurodeles waltl TaxID=8319 RepID=A0AAV7Q908_PLEWA|nr:hypothetical protein NDU88_002490 [Pleurodeles waltl]
MAASTCAAVRQDCMHGPVFGPAEALTFGSGGHGCKPGLQPSPRRREWSERARTGVTRSRLSSAAIRRSRPAGTAPAG